MYSYIVNKIERYCVDKFEAHRIRQIEYPYFGKLMIAVAWYLTFFGAIALGYFGFRGFVGVLALCLITTFIKLPDLLVGNFILWYQIWKFFFVKHWVPTVIVIGISLYLNFHGYKLESQLNDIVTPVSEYIGRFHDYINGK